MKNYVSVMVLAFLSFLMVSCASTYRGNAYPATDLTAENWQASVDKTSANWARGAGRWFLTGDPSPAESANVSVTPETAMSTMQVQVPQFDTIKISGPFQVQLFAASHQSVYVYAPNYQMRNVYIKTAGRTLYVGTAGDVPKGSQTQNVIIRIGVVNLHCLENNGSARVEGRYINSDRLRIISNGSGNIYLAGAVNLQFVKVSGSGCVNVFGAVTPVLDILTGGTGSVNVSGNLGVRSIIHKAGGDINLVGVNSDGVIINAYGQGKIGLCGQMNLREITARDNTRVFVMNANGPKLNIYASGSACVGVMGTTGDLTINASDNARVFGRYLCSRNAYVRASYHAHVNVAASSRIYASATESSSIYFFGKPDALSQFVSENGVIIPVWSDDARQCLVPTVRPVVTRRVYKDQPAAKVMPLNYSSHVRVTPSSPEAPQYLFRRKGTNHYTAVM